MDNLLPNVLQETYGLRQQGKRDPMMSKKTTSNTAKNTGVDSTVKSSTYKAPTSNLKAAGLSSGSFSNDNFFDSFVSKPSARDKKTSVPDISTKDESFLGKSSSKSGLEGNHSNKSSSDSLFDESNFSGKTFSTKGNSSGGSTPASAFDDLLGGTSSSAYNAKNASNSFREDSNGAFNAFNGPNTEGTPSSKSSKPNPTDPFNAFEDNTFFNSGNLTTNSPFPDLDELDPSQSHSNKSSSKSPAVPRTPSFERSTKSSQAKSRLTTDSPRSASKSSRSNPPPRSSSTDEGSRSFNHSKFSPKGKDRWFTVEDVILQTQPHPTPPFRPPPPIIFPKSNSKTEPNRTHTKPQFAEPEKTDPPRTRSNASPFTEPEFSPFGFENGVPPPMPPLVKPIPPLVRPSPTSKMQAGQSHVEEQLFGFDDEPFSAKKSQFPPESVSSPSVNNLKGFDSASPAAERQRVSPESNIPPLSTNMHKGDDFGSNVKRQSPSLSPSSSTSSYSFVPPSGAMRESPFVPSVETNDSAMAAEKSSNAMKEVLERAQRRAEVARELREKEKEREREREKERQDKEAERMDREKERADRERQRAERERSEREKLEREKEKEKERTAAFAAAREANSARSFPSSSSSSANASNSTQYDFFTNTNANFGEEWKPQGPVNLDDLGKASQTKGNAFQSQNQNQNANTDDWMNVLGGVNVSAPDSFQEIAGESDDRRKLRYERHMRLKERAAAALEEKNKRDMIMQKEQEDRHRAGEVLDMEIKMWAQGKEGNIRALLSTLQYVLWPECKWEAISLTDIIAGASVKKAYRKATLCLHPDKVQQRGATVQQKYIAEKVFDLLKEAWNKFNQEELF